MMRLAEMLSYADIDQLHQLANTYSCDCNIHSKNELIQSLLGSIKREANIKEQLESLKKEEFHFLMYIVFDSRSTFTLEDLRAKAKFSYMENLDRDTYRKLVSVALKKGWIFRGVSRNAVSAFQVPEDMRKAWANTILKMEWGEQPNYSDPPFYRDEGIAIIEDLHQFLQYVSRHQPQLTSDGVIYKRNQQQLMELMSVQEELIEKGGWRFGYGRHFRDYPDRFSLIYDFCYYRGYIREEPGNALWTTPEAEEAFQLPPEILAMEMYKFWLRLYKRPISGLPMFIRLIGRAAERWMEEEALIRVLVPRIRPYYYDNEDSIARNRILKMMVHLGLLRKGIHNENTWVLQTTRLGKTLLESVEGYTMKDIILDRKDEG
ncbi:hypothetical protein [Ammoniphilus sp. CFH 90114]|uniref:hypothetical protein n=1 Tax=Ammoniphilus sp. CFH 90114 TaxID=2493665 RepID=UPI00100F8FF4|nr:hypothetical protein [Ammoniphilus sp. CFH 90114]RXT13927.1 hypothetical protein EIZ39_07275 [Ammoniphilus sp. CFH 90114]